MLAPALALVAGWTALGECANLAAVAAFLVVVPPGPDAHGAAHPSRAHLRWALLLLRLGVGTALIVLAFSESSRTRPWRSTRSSAPRPRRLRAGRHPRLAGDLRRLAGATELLFGLLVISGAFPQVAVLVAMVPFIATLLLFGQTEMVGHLPVYGVFLALLVYGSSTETAGAVRWLPSLRGRRVPATAAATPPRLPTATAAG